MIDKKLIEELSNAAGVSGAEDEVRRLIKEQISNFTRDIIVDAMGNLITYYKARKNKPKVLITAHMDEVGLMIDKIEESGHLRFKPVGGIDERVLLSKSVLIGKDKIPGVIGSKPIHLIKDEEELKKVVKIEDMFIDIGAKNKADAEKVVKIGDTICFSTRFEDYGGILKGKAFDDRLGCACLISLIKSRDINLSFWAGFTVQEEVGLRGARVVGYRVNPDIVLVLEGTPAGDYPQKRDVSKAAEMGEGAVITIMDRTTICDKGLVDLLVKIAEERKIKYQFKRPDVGGTDAGAIHLTRGGVRSAVIAVPVRYAHSPVSLAKQEDLEATLQLAKDFLYAISGGK